ncbi:hypothetical protein GOV07_02320 [Candidatus Woesearchaeota archaeon]|nr:hypothetical protein [Candidatus Woesearchaeota archaeon]
MKSKCKGGCGQEASFKGWCAIKWKSGKRFGVNCPEIEKKRASNISKFRTEEAKRGENPMQNPEICARNHSPERNKKCSETLKNKGVLGVLPQQIESKELKRKRQKNVSRSLAKLWEAGEHPRQKETLEERRNRLDKMSETLILLGKKGKLPIQNMTPEQKKRFGEKISKTLREGILTGRIKLSPSWKKVPYKDLILRSRWEQEMAEFLDKHNFRWEYETKRLTYWDSDKKTKAITIPDFYIPSLNLIIEVKSNADFKAQKTKDKITGIKKHGFNAILAGRKEMSMLKNNEEQFLELMRDETYEKSQS